MPGAAWKSEACFFDAHQGAPAPVRPGTPSPAARARGAAGAPTRPKISFNRWQEDWSALSNPALRTEPFDALKYIPIMPGDPKSYVSLGMTLRERFESVNAQSFGTSGARPDNYLIQRLQFHADFRFNEHWQLFLQVEDDRAFGKNVTTPVDQDPFDLRLGFLAYVNKTQAGTFKGRVGRQDFDFDLLSTHD